MSTIRDQLVAYNDPIISTAKDAILARLWRRMRNTLSVEESKFDYLIEQYIIRTETMAERGDVSTAKANIRKEYLRSHMTWKVFIKAFRILNSKSIGISMTLKFSTGPIKEVSVSRRIPLWNIPAQPGDVTSPEQALYDLYNDIQIACGVNIDRFSELFMLYAQANKIPQNATELSCARGNLSKEFKNKGMSWKVFMKGLSFLTVSQFDIGVQVTRFDDFMMQTYMRIILESKEYP